MKQDAIEGKRHGKACKLTKNMFVCSAQREVDRVVSGDGEEDWLPEGKKRMESFGLGISSRSRGRRGRR